MKPLEIYLHIPFCARKCHYCDFLSGIFSEEIQEQYVQGLVKEIRHWKKKTGEYEVISIFLGGGTPSILSLKQIEKIMEALGDTFLIVPQAEVTIECNPGTVSWDKLQGYKRLGINRLSLGLQSTLEEELKALGRIHTYEMFLTTYNNARKVGFNNINVDLMSAIPGQTLSSYEKSLQRVVSIEPEHISSYSLIIEEGTKFYEQFVQGKQYGFLPLPKEEEERKMYERTKEVLEEAKYHRYEISNYAMKGKECKHNVGYWRRVSYLGLGVGASSFFEQERFTGRGTIKDYLKKIEVLKDIKQADSFYINREVVTSKDAMEETMILGLRMMEGVSFNAFEKEFHISLQEVYLDVLEKYSQLGLLAWDNDKVALTDKGIDVSNVVLADFLL